MFYICKTECGVGKHEATTGMGQPMSMWCVCGAFCNTTQELLVDLTPDWYAGTAVPGTQFRSGTELISVPKNFFELQFQFFLKAELFGQFRSKIAGTVEFFGPGTGTVPTYEHKYYSDKSLFNAIL